MDTQMLDELNNLRAERDALLAERDALREALRECESLFDVIYTCGVEGDKDSRAYHGYEIASAALAAGSK